MAPPFTIFQNIKVNCNHRQVFLSTVKRQLLNEVNMFLLGHLQIWAHQGWSAKKCEQRPPCQFEIWLFVTLLSHLAARQLVGLNLTGQKSGNTLPTKMWHWAPKLWPKWSIIMVFESNFYVNTLVIVSFIKNVLEPFFENLWLLLSDWGRINWFKDIFPFFPSEPVVKFS